MYQVKEISADPKQKHTLVLPNGKNVVLNLEYKPMQYGWFMSFTYGTFSANNIRIVASPNIIHQLKNLVPFGIACFVTGNQEPTLPEDFSSGRAQFFLLDTAETTTFEEILSGQVSA